MRLILAFYFLATLIHAEPPRFRTDADGPVTGQDGEKSKAKSGIPEWYQLVDGQFPPPGSAHAISGELIKVDHLERQFLLRVDRNDNQQAGFQDLPLDSVMLPYGAIYYRGAPAALQDIPLGTHLHGLYYLKAPGSKSAPPPTGYGRVTAEAAFKRCLQLEDDFSHRTRQEQIWKIDAVNLAEKKLTATLQQNGVVTGKPAVFDLLASTLVFQGNSFAKLDAIAVGQTVQFNLTWATLYGPGRITDIWLDEPSRRLAIDQQLERHRLHTRERGLPGWVTDVDDEKQIVTLTFFGGVDPKLFGEMKDINEKPQGWPFSVPEDDPKAPKGGIAVARECLMPYDPVNDRKGGNILHIDTVPVEPGGSGVQIKVKCGIMLEGYRPCRIVRFYPANWEVIALPREELFEGRE
ncbi:hypothetical protein BH11VER1_BH11VER1_09130 [soil metagenome]